VFVADFWIGTEQSTGLLTIVRLVFVETRCVLISGSPRHEWAPLVDRKLVEDVLTKPFDALDLVALVEGSRGER
jgi:hypothetical protein